MKFSSLEEGSQRFAFQFFIILLEPDYTSVATRSKLGTHTDRYENDSLKCHTFFFFWIKKKKKKGEEAVFICWSRDESLAKDTPLNNSHAWECWEKKNTEFKCLLILRHRWNKPWNKDWKVEQNIVGVKKHPRDDGAITALPATPWEKPSPCLTEGKSLTPV